MFLTGWRRLLLKFDSENKFVHIYNCKTFINRHDNGEHLQEVVFSIDNIDKIKAYVKNRRIGVIYEAEEFYTRILRLPRVNKGALEGVVRNELSKLFNNADGISYSFEVLDTGKKEIKVLVYCINSDKTKLLEKCLNNNIMKGIYLIQSCFIVFFKRFIRHKSYICVFTYDSHLYIVGCLSGKMIYNYVAKNFDGDGNLLQDKLKYMMVKFSEKNQECSGRGSSHIYIANFPYNELYENMIKTYECTYLGRVENYKLLKAFL